MIQEHFQVRELFPVLISPLLDTNLSTAKLYCIAGHLSNCRNWLVKINKFSFWPACFNNKTRVMNRSGRLFTCKCTELPKSTKFVQQALE